MGNHLMVEQGNISVIFVLDVGCHSNHHGAVHTLKTGGKRADRVTITDKLVRAFGMGQLEVSKVHCAALLIEATRLVFLLVRDFGYVIVIDHLPILQELDSSRHELVDVAEVKEIFAVIFRHS